VTVSAFQAWQPAKLTWTAGFGQDLTFDGIRLPVVSFKQREVGNGAQNWSLKRAIAAAMMAASNNSSPIFT
jgi:hypothetical protein